MFEDNPEVKIAFNNLRNMNEVELRNSKELRAHALRVMGMVDKVHEDITWTSLFSAFITP